MVHKGRTWIRWAKPADRGLEMEDWPWWEIRGRGVVFVLHTMCDFECVGCTGLEGMRWIRVLWSDGV